MDHTEIQTFRPTYDATRAAQFASLNKRWIEEYFVLEAPDIEALDNPMATIIEPGGEIFFAVRNGTVLGTAAAMPHEPGVVELAKMAVDPAFQGRGIGRMLVGAVLDFARASGAHTVSLLSNTKLAPAIQLYRRVGFVEKPLSPSSGYSRANIYMELRLDRAK
jgi:GNAT superfamily N-acetyltransferase